MSVYARVRAEGSASCKRRTCVQRAEPAGAFLSLKGPCVKFCGERSAQLQEHIGPEDTNECDTNELTDVFGAVAAKWRSFHSVLANCLNSDDSVARPLIFT